MPDCQYGINVVNTTLILLLATTNKQWLLRCTLAGSNTSVAWTIGCLLDPLPRPPTGRDVARPSRRRTHLNGDEEGEHRAEWQDVVGVRQGEVRQPPHTAHRHALHRQVRHLAKADEDRDEDGNLRHKLAAATNVKKSLRCPGNGLEPVQNGYRHLNIETHTVSVSNLQSSVVSTDDWMVHF